jgi:hypothetical protein
LTQTPDWHPALVIVLGLGVVEVADKAAVHQIVLEHAGDQCVDNRYNGGREINSSELYIRV